MPSREQMINDQGFDARVRDQPIDTCPHTGEDREIWRRGWWNAHNGLRDVDPNSDQDVPTPH